MNRLLIFILVVAAAVRLVGLSTAPPSLYWEEAALGYDAYSILKTGKDLHGHAWPVVAFESFGDYKPSGYFYLTVPFVAIFGLNSWAVRLPSALLGIITVGLVWLIARHLFRDWRIAAASALTLALLPWHIQFSRAGFEVQAATFFLTLGLYWLLHARKHSVWLIPAALAFVASAYTYHGLRVLAPLMALWTWWCFGKTWAGKKSFYVAIIVGILTALPIALAIRQPAVMQRFAETSLFSTSKAVSDTNLWREADGGVWWSRIVHHRYWYWMNEIAAGMASHFSPLFLLISGDGNQRHQTGLFGLLFDWQALPLLAGSLLLIKKKLWWLWGWIVLATVPAALTNLTPHTLRFLPASPAFSLIIGVGMIGVMDWMWRQRWRMVGFVIVAIIIVGELVAYGVDYAVGYPARSSKDWQYGYEQVITYLRSHTQPTDTIWITRAYGRPSIYTMFYWPISPGDVQQYEVSEQHDQGEFLTLGRFSFTDKPPENARILVSDSVLPHTLLNTVAFLDGSIAFYIYEK